MPRSELHSAGRYKSRTGGALNETVTQVSRLLEKEEVHQLRACTTLDHARGFMSCALSCAFDHRYIM